ncbi:MAG: hypothetical protein M9891_01205 [Austwickia sp.]|nr:hypothetical protein [Austwickia sp.]MCO5307909.1 hypothetical protein [Austwickia sp.]
MEITQLLSTAATVLFLALGVALMVVLAVVPAWLRHDAERVERVEHAGRADVTEMTGRRNRAQRGADHVLAA